MPHEQIFTSFGCIKICLRLEMNQNEAKQSKTTHNWSAIDIITQNEESKIDYDYVMMMCNNKFEHTVEIETSNNTPLNYFFLLVLSHGIWNVIHFITIP